MPRPKLAGMAAIVALLLVWTVRSFMVDADSHSPSTAQVVAAGEVAGPLADAPAMVAPVAVGDVRGVPVGYPQTQAGAVTSAVNWVASFPRLMRLNPLSLQNTLGELLSESGASTGVDEVLADYFELFEELGPEFRDRVWIESPLQTSLLGQTDSAAQVEVWSVVITGGGPTDAAVVSIWRTHRIDMVWERDDWKVDGVQVSEGPTPLTTELGLPADPSEFVDVDTWTPAVFADTTTSAGND